MQKTGCVPLQTRHIRQLRFTKDQNSRRSSGHANPSDQLYRQPCKHTSGQGSDYKLLCDVIMLYADANDPLAAVLGNRIPHLYNAMKHSRRVLNSGFEPPLDVSLSFLISTKHNLSLSLIPTKNILF